MSEAMSSGVSRRSLRSRLEDDEEKNKSFSPPCQTWS